MLSLLDCQAQLERLLRASLGIWAAHVFFSVGMLGPGQQPSGPVTSPWRWTTTRGWATEEQRARVASSFCSWESLPGDDPSFCCMGSCGQTLCPPWAPQSSSHSGTSSETLSLCWSCAPGQRWPGVMDQIGPQSFWRGQSPWLPRSGSAPAHTNSPLSWGWVIALSFPSFLLDFHPLCSVLVLVWARGCL